MRRIDLVSATLAGWARLNPQQRDRFFQAGLKAALRLDRQDFRSWLLRRVRTPPLAPPIDLAVFAISDGDVAALLKALAGEPSDGRPIGRQFWRSQGAVPMPAGWRIAVERTAYSLAIDIWVIVVIPVASRQHLLIVASERWRAAPNELRNCTSA